MARPPKGLLEEMTSLPASRHDGRASPADTPRVLGIGRWAPGLIALLAVALYFGTLRFEFVWDDLALIVHNQFVRHLSALPTWGTLTAEQASLGHFTGNLYRPGVLISLAVDFALWGNSALGFHLTNVVLHGLTAWLVYLLTQVVTGRADLAMVTAILFAVHPAHVEAVAWTSARGDLLVSVWMVVAVLLYHLSLRSRGWRRAGWYGGTLGAMSIGLLFKESAATLPPLLLLLEGLGPRIGATRAGPWFRAFLRSFPFWGLAAAHLVFLSRPIQSYNPHLLTPHVLLARLPGSLETFARYVGLLLFPVSMRPFYALPRPTSFSEPWPLAGIVILLGLVVLGVFCWRRFPAAAFGLGWFLLTIAPYTDLLAISPRTMGIADRYLYGPSIGFLLLVAVLLDAAGAYLSRRHGVAGTMILGTATGILAAICAAGTAWYVPVWQDNLSLFSRMVRDFPQAPEPRLNLGTTYLDMGNGERGIAELETAVRLHPNWIRPQIPLAMATVQLRDPAEGFRIFDRIAPVAADDYFYYVMRGRAHLLVREPEAAAKVLVAGLRRFPASLELHILLARAREAQDDSAGTIQAYGQVLALDPRLAFAHEGLGNALAKQGNYEAAAQSFARALELTPDRISPLRLLAMAREAEGQVDESLRLWGEVARRSQDPRLRAEAEERIRTARGAPRSSSP